MIPMDFIEQLKAANPIEQVMGSYVQVKRSGSLMECLCPFHTEKSPSCKIYTDGQDPHFYCFGCHKGGDVITFIREIENVGYVEAVRILAERAGLTIPMSRDDEVKYRQKARLLELNRAAARYYFETLCMEQNAGLQYFISRGITPDIVKRFGLGYAPDRRDGLLQAMRAKGFRDEELVAVDLAKRDEKGRIRDRFRNRVMFPIIDTRGSVVAFGGRTLEPDHKPKYLNTSDTPVFKKGETLFALQLAKKSQSKRMILCEGYMDVIALHQAGFDTAIASLGTALTQAQCRMIRQNADELVLSYDSDGAGQRATMTAINLLREVSVATKVLQIPDAKDPDEYIRKFGAPHFRKLLEHAVDATRFLLDRCKAGIPIEDENARLIALERSIDILAQIENPRAREHYARSVAQEYEMRMASIESGIAERLATKQYQEKRQEKRKVHTQQMYRDPLNPTAAEHSREAKAEEQLLCFLFRYPDELERVTAQIAPEQFVTELHRRIYAEYLQRMQPGVQFSLSVFSEAFTTDEIGYITGMIERHKEIYLSVQVAQDCIEILLAYEPASKDAGDLDDDAFRALFANLSDR